jgi:hypothetical protein
VRRAHLVDALALVVSGVGCSFFIVDFSQYGSGVEDASSDGASGGNGADACDSNTCMCQGVAVEVSSDTANCGACGRACPPSATQAAKCTAGACTTSSLLWDSLPDAPTSIAVDDDVAVWASDEIATAGPLAGGSPSVIAQLEPLLPSPHTARFHATAVEASRAFFALEWNRRPTAFPEPALAVVASAPLDGCDGGNCATPDTTSPSDTIAFPWPSPVLEPSFAVDAEAVYTVEFDVWSSGTQESVFRHRRSPGAAQELLVACTIPATLTHETVPGDAIATDEQRIFFSCAVGAAGRGLYVLAKTCGAPCTPTLLAAMEAAPGVQLALAVDETNVFYSDGARVRRAPKEAGVGAVEDFTTVPTPPSAIAVDARSVYVLSAASGDASGDHELRRYPKGGCAGACPAIVARGAIAAFAISSRQIVWTEGTSLRSLPVY